MNWYAQLGMSTEIPRRGMDPHPRPCREEKKFPSIPIPADAHKGALPSIHVPTREIYPRGEPIPVMK